MKVVHIITGLDTGGAEMMLYKLVGAMDRSRFQIEVISLSNAGDIGRMIEAAGIPVRALGMRRGVPNPQAIAKLAQWLRAAKPDIVQTWMYHADLIGGLAARQAGVRAIVWGVHNSSLDLRGSKRATLWIAKACTLSSQWLPQRIVCCSEVARRTHAAQGYANEKMQVIPNAFDLSAFRPDAEARRSVREELQIADETPLIGMIARYHPMKDHANFFAAASRLSERLPEARYLLCGGEMTRENAALGSIVANAGVASRCHLLGLRNDIPRLTAALDLATLSSFSEGFPNVLGEAMACGVPCVTTNVGDAALIVGETGRVVPPKNPEALAAAWEETLALAPQERQALGKAARRRIEENFTLPQIVERYQALYEEIASRDVPLRSRGRRLDARH